ncbi:MAG: energy-coupling factor transporter ATPase [Erysipelotrichaceae bacterium]|nr:energy-coupling factor transporter ATPase [Erysipelotrichaceae bacterium]
MSIIEVNHVTFGYEENKKVLKDVSFKVEKGSYTTILGHNGSGKSTIAKLLIGLPDVIDEGEIIIGGIKLSEKTLNDVRLQIGIVFQNPDNQFIGSTVRDDIAFGLENLCVPHDDMEPLIREWAGKVNMLDFLDHEPTKLSGGQKQRVAIAGIMAMGPDIIILDEATSMLDPRGRKEINELIHQLNRERQMTILSITHDIEEAALSDAVILLNKGQIVSSGKPEEVLSDVKMIESLKLDVPFAYKVSTQLRAMHLPVDATINNEDLVNTLCQLRSKM